MQSRLGERHSVYRLPSDLSSGNCWIVVWYPSKVACPVTAVPGIEQSLDIDEGLSSLAPNHRWIISKNCMCIDMNRLSGMDRWRMISLPWTAVEARVSRTVNEPSPL